MVFRQLTAAEPPPPIETGASSPLAAFHNLFIRLLYFFFFWKLQSWLSVLVFCQLNYGNGCQGQLAPVFRRL